MTTARSGHPDASPPTSPDVEIRLPAESAYVAVLRMATAGIAARLDFTLDDIEDLRIAVGEASALVLDGAPAGGSLLAAYSVGPGRLDLRVGVAATPGTSVAAPDESAFGWQVLTALTDDLRVSESDGVAWVSFTVTSSVG